MVMSDNGSGYWDYGIYGMAFSTIHTFLYGDMTVRYLYVL